MTDYDRIITAIKADIEKQKEMAVNPSARIFIGGEMRAIEIIENMPSAEKTADYFNKLEVLEPIKHFGAIECPNCGRLLMLEEQTYDWCKGCKEYDTEKHCCHRYSSFICESLQDNINAVLEDIKAEIEQVTRFGNAYQPIEYGLLMLIIDKHINGRVV